MMFMIAIKFASALAIGMAAFLLTGGSGILWAPGSGSGGNLVFTLLGATFGLMLPTEIAFWKSRKGKSNANP